MAEEYQPEHALEYQPEHALEPYAGGRRAILAPARRTIRTVVAVLIALAGLAPLIYREAAQADPAAATGWLGGVLAAAAAITRVMALPAVDAFLARFVPWLAASPRDGYEDESAG